MILFIYDEFAERLVSFIEKTAARRNIPYTSIRTDHFQPSLDFRFSIDSGEMQLQLHTELRGILGIFCKFTELPAEATLQSIPLEYKQYARLEVRDAFMGTLLASCPDAKWMNRPEAEFLSRIKIHQLRLAKSFGFLVPDTVISCDRSKLLEFWQANDGYVVTKAIHRGWVAETKHTDENYVLFTSDVERHHLDQLEEINWPPILFQEKIRKKYELRVLVVGSHHFTARLDSSHITDWRVDEDVISSSTPIDIPSEIAIRCVQLVAKLNLVLAAIDLIVDENDNYYFLEANSQGGWEWMEVRLSYPISDTIINILSSSLSS